MHIDQIETFLDLCETRSFQRTADRLGVTQSSVSGRVKALEAALGRRLFTRSRVGTVLTTDGLRFEPHARLLLHQWISARQAASDPGAVTLRIGLQHDLADRNIGRWAEAFRAQLPDARFYIEPDYSIQMGVNLVSGALDLAVLYSPSGHPDLHVESLGEVSYRMVSTDAERLAEVGDDSYILANYSPAFAAAHAARHPSLSGVAVSSGQEAAVAGLLTAMRGTAYVLSTTARALAASGEARVVADAPPIAQTVYAAVHLRNRHRAPHRRLIGALRSQFEPPAGRRPRAG
jgi:DNA-binding transcriptional LysR family regulator